MAYASATYPGAPPLVGRAVAFPACRRVFDRAAIGLGTVAAAAAVAGGVAAAAVWIVVTALSADPHIHPRPSYGPATLALANDRPSRDGAADDFGSARIWNKAAYAPHVTRMAERSRVAEPIRVSRKAEPAPVVVAKSVPAVVVPPAPAHARVRIARAHVEVPRVPLPRPRPALPEIARAKVAPAASRVALAVPAPAIPEKRQLPQRAPDKAIALPARDGRTAVYDIAAHTVFMPDGEKLEAHSGLGRRLDDPRYVKVKDRGPTPPNVYRLTLRERLFHGVRAIRLKPVDDDKMFGRDGMLAHSYMLGPNGQSNGCVSFKDYRKFLTAFLNGEVDRLIVVPRAGAMVARAARPRHAERYAFNSR